MSLSVILMVLAGVALLIFTSVRQMQWQRVNTANLLKVPVLLCIGGLLIAAQTFAAPGALHFGAADLILIAFEAGVAGAGGWLMGQLTDIATIDGGTHSRLRAAGLAVWFAFLVLRVGGVALAQVDHLTVASSTPLIFFLISIVKGTQALTVRARVQQHERSRPAHGAFGRA
jgi:hypothetical protein